MSHIKGMRTLRSQTSVLANASRFQSSCLSTAHYRASSRRELPNQRRYPIARYSSTAAQARTPPASPPAKASSQPLPVPISKASTPDLQTLNPPASTRPAILDLPIRTPDTSTIYHLFSTGKAYAVFYKTGLKAIWTNYKTLRAQRSSPSSDGASHETRAQLLFRERTRHDLARLPVFALIVLIFGEFTPLVIIFLPRLAPHTCRIPRQLTKMRQQAEERRGQSFRALARFAVRAPAHTPNKSVQPGMANQSALSESNSAGSLFAPSVEWEKALPGHIVRTLGLGNSLWDRAGFDVPFAEVKAKKAVARLAKDDELIRSGGGVRGLEPDEVTIAAEERGLDVLDKKEVDLRAMLGRWLELTRADGENGEEERTRRVKMLLGMRPEEWKSFRV